MYGMELIIRKGKISNYHILIERGTVFMLNLEGLIDILMAYRNQYGGHIPVKLIQLSESPISDIVSSMICSDEKETSLYLTDVGYNHLNEININIGSALRIDFYENDKKKRY